MAELFKTELYLVDGTNTITIGDVRSSTIVLSDAVTIYRDGRVEVNPAYSTDEAAQKFWEAVRIIAPDFFKP